MMTMHIMQISKIIVLFQELKSFNANKDSMETWGLLLFFLPQNKEENKDEGYPQDVQVGQWYDEDNV